VTRLSWNGKRAGYLVVGVVLATGSAVGLIYQQAGAVTTTDRDGLTVTYSRPGYVGTTDDGLTYAPRPATEFNAQQCDLSPRPLNREVGAGQLLIPAAGVEAPLGVSADLSTLPDAPQAVRYQDSAPVGALEGKTVIAGHVDYAPESPGTGVGRLSPFGQLHTASACDHVYVTDAEGQLHEYVLTDLYTVPQEQIEDTGIYSVTGDPALVLVTCSGPSVGDATGDDLFAYRYNLILEATPVTVAS